MTNIRVGKIGAKLMRSLGNKLNSRSGDLFVAIIRIGENVGKIGDESSLCKLNSRSGELFVTNIRVGKVGAKIVE